MASIPSIDTSLVASFGQAGKDCLETQAQGASPLSPSLVPVGARAGVQLVPTRSTGTARRVRGEVVVHFDSFLVEAGSPGRRTLRL